MKPYIWIYEYKNDDTIGGATFFDGPLEDLPECIALPHLRGDWHWRIDTTYKEEEEE